MKIILFGGNPYDEMGELLTTIKSLMEENNRKRLLVDAIEIAMPSEIEKFAIGELGVGIFSASINIAVFIKPEYINKYFENVAVNRGGRLYLKKYRGVYPVVPTPLKTDESLDLAGMELLVEY